MTEPEQSRADLLAILHFDEQVILASFAERWLFPDVTLAEWCTTHEVRVRTEWMGDYKFYVFNYIEEEEF